MQVRKIGIILSWVILFGLPVFAQGSTQHLSVTNLANKTGKLYIGWYANAESYKAKNKAAISRVVEVSESKEVSIAFEHVPPGMYAIAIFFDENNNGKMDTNLLGIPKEKYGFSNNVFPLMRAASYKEASFPVTEKEASLTIHLK